MCGAGGRAGRLLQFYSWGSFQPVGRPLAAPRWLAWDPDVSMAALAYSDAITLCSTRPSFGPFATIPLKVTQGAFLVLSCGPASSCAWPP